MRGNVEIVECTFFLDALVLFLLWKRSLTMSCFPPAPKCFMFPMSTELPTHLTGGLRVLLLPVWRRCGAKVNVGERRRVVLALLVLTGINKYCIEI